MSAKAADSETLNGTTEPQPVIEDADLRPDETKDNAIDARATDIEQSIQSHDVPATVEDSNLDDKTTGQSIQSATVADPRLDESGHRSVQSDFIENTSPVGEVNQPELRKDEGSRTFTMRELLNELKNGDANDHSEAEKQEASSPYRQDSKPPQQHAERDNAAMDLVNSVTSDDDEGRSRLRILTFAARRYASAIEANPEDYNALYNWALVLQETADNVSPDSTSPSKDALLIEACKKYDEATRLCPTLHDAHYNWAIAISDRAKLRGRTKEAEEFWKQVKCFLFFQFAGNKNYEKAVQLNWNSPQALNNWGLALQELSSIVPAREKQTIVKSAINKFRAAIRLQFDFHRAIYNLGTVLYGLAEDISRTAGSVNAKEVSPDELYSQSAIYIAAAHALKPTYTVYTSALKLVRSMLPLPYLKVGYLTAPPVGSSVAPHSDWKRTEFVLNHEGLQQDLMGPRWKGKGSEAKALADPMSNIVSQLKSTLIQLNSYGLLSGCSVLLEVETEQTELLNRACFGRPIVTAQKGKQWFQLAMEEAFYLCYNLRCLKIVGGDECTKSDEELWKYMISKRETFPDLFKAYSYLRTRNWVVRSGSQYGVDFVAYRHHPSLVHSEYAVVVLSEGDGNANGRLRLWSDFQCTIRLCGSVAKTLLVLHIDKNGAGAASPSCLESCIVEERTVTRWSPEQSREDKTVAENGSKQGIVFNSC